MYRGNDPLLRVQQQDRGTVRHADPDHDTWLVGNNGVTFNREEVRVILVGFVDHQDIAAMHLPDGNQGILVDFKGAGQQAAVSFHVMGRVQGVGSQVQGVVRRSRYPLVPSGESLYGTGRACKISGDMLDAP